MTNEKLKLTILSPVRKLVDAAEVDRVTLPGSEGQIEVLPGHISMVGTLETGAFSFHRGDQDQKAGVISTGFFEVEGDHVSVVAETLELSGEIDIERAKNAQKKAEEMLTQAGIDEHQFKKYQLKLERALIRQQVAGKS